MPLPANFNTITLYDDFIDNPTGRPIVGTGTIKGHNVRREVNSGLNLVPVARTFTLTPTVVVLAGETLTTGHFEIDVPLSVDADLTNPDTYTVTMSLTGVDPLLATVGPFEILLTAALGTRVRLTDLLPATPITPASAAFLTAVAGDARYVQTPAGGTDGQVLAKSAGTVVWATGGTGGTVGPAGPTGPAGPAGPTGPVNTNAASLTGTLPPAVVGAASITAAKVAADVATQAEIDAITVAKQNTLRKYATITTAQAGLTAGEFADGDLIIVLG